MRGGATSLPPPPPGRSPTIAYEPFALPHQRPAVIAQTFACTAVMAGLLHLARPHIVATELIIGTLLLDVFFILYITRVGLSVGRDWLVEYRAFGKRCLDSTTLRKITLKRSSRPSLILEDARGRMAMIDPALLQRSPKLWKTLRAALRQSVANGCRVNDLARTLLEL